MEIDSLLFYNTPICSEEEDVLGIGTYIHKLNEAIDSDLQMIAITSPFGAGKTSAIKLLEAARISKRTKNGNKKEEMIRISMCSPVNCSLLSPVILLPLRRVHCFYLLRLAFLL